MTLSELVRQELIEQAPEQEQLEFSEWLDWLDRVGADESISLPPGTVAAALHEGRAERF